jgi:hypothetical protein
MMRKEDMIAEVCLHTHGLRNEVVVERRAEREGGSRLKRDLTPNELREKAVKEEV